MRWKPSATSFEVVWIVKSMLALNVPPGGSFGTRPNLRSMRRLFGKPVPGSKPVT